jgi:hypothetical protein
MSLCKINSGKCRGKYGLSEKYIQYGVIYAQFLPRKIAVWVCIGLVHLLK